MKEENKEYSEGCKEVLKAMQVKIGNSIYLEFCIC